MNSSLSTFAATLFALLNPLGVLPVFVSYAARERLGVQRFVALLISLTVFGLLLLFLFTGAALLRFFGISLDSFRIAGGILLLLIGIRLVMGDSTAAKEMAERQAISDWKEAESLYRQIVVPLAMPLLVGPGVIANIILYASEAEAAKNDAFFVGLALVCAGISLLTFMIFLSGEWLKRVFGDVGLSIATRILGVLVASMGIQFVVTGVTNIIVHTIAPQILKS
jgi:multiple antibiotic resistance protein